MKFRCPSCKKLVNYDGRLAHNRKLADQKTTVSYCEKTGKTVRLVRV